MENQNLDVEDTGPAADVEFEPAAPAPTVATPAASFPVVMGKKQRSYYVVPTQIRDQLIGFISSAYRGAPEGRHVFEWAAKNDATVRGEARDFTVVVRAAFPIDLGGISDDELAKAITDVPRAMGRYVYPRPSEPLDVNDAPNGDVTPADAAAEPPSVEEAVGMSEAQTSSEATSCDGEPNVELARPVSSDLEGIGVETGQQDGVVGADNAFC